MKLNEIFRVSGNSQISKVFGTTNDTAKIGLDSVSTLAHDVNPLIVLTNERK